MFQTITDECRLRNYSPKTVQAYQHHNKKFLQFCKKKPQQVTNQDIRMYLLYLDGKGSSTSQVNLAHNAINFYFRNVLKRNFSKIPFQKRENRVKEVLNQKEIKELIFHIKNKKHKLMISLLYATGIRVSELVNINLEHLDFGKKQLLVKQGKGQKDRHTILSDKVIYDIKNYLAETEITGYLFPAKKGHLSVRTVQEIIKQAAKKAKIINCATPHRLRHSFATHLYEGGTNFEVIQKLLGHKNIKTTQQYARVANKHLVGIKSPHDGL